MTLNLREQIQENPIILAPMDAITDIGFRELCEENNASYTITEMISIESLIRNKVPKNRYYRRNLKINCVQLFGSNIKSFEKAVKYLEKTKQADIIDINFGCPSISLINNNSGSALLKDPQKIGKIVSIVVKNSSVPVTAKIRLGYNKKNFIEVAKQIEKNGADLITLHARTTKQKYSGKADWDSIKELYEKIKIPLIGNGDINSEEDIKKINNYCDGLMIGRPAIGNPYLFKRMYYYYKKSKKLETKEEIKQIQKKMFLKYLDKIKNVDLNKKDFRIKQQAMWFMKGIEGTKELRKQIQSKKNINKIIKIIKEF